MLKLGDETMGVCFWCYLLVIMVLPLPICSITCEDIQQNCKERIESRNYLCYHPGNQTECCQTCKSVEKPMEGCQFGDHDPDLCSQPQLECSEHSLKCCHTCAAVSTTIAFDLLTSSDEQDDQSYFTASTRAAVMLGSNQNTYSSVSMETMEAQPAKLTTFSTTTEDYVTHSASDQSSEELAEQESESETPEVNTVDLDDIELSNTADEMLVTTELEELNDDITTPYTEEQTQREGNWEETSGTTIQPPLTVSYETSEPTEIPSTTVPTTKEDISTQPYPPTDSIEAGENTESPEVETTDFDDEVFTTEPSVELVITTEVEEQNEDITTLETDSQTTNFRKLTSAVNTNTTLHPPVTISYETREPTETSLTTSPATKEDLSTRPNPPTDSEEVGDYTEPTDSEYKTTIEFEEEIKTDEPTTKIITVSLPVTVSYETTEPTEVPTATSASTKEDLSTQPHPPTKDDSEEKEVSTKEPKRTTEAESEETTDDTEVTDVESTDILETKDWLTTSKLVTNSSMTTFLPTTSYVTSDTVKSTSTTMPRTTKDYTTNEETTVDITTKKSSTDTNISTELSTTTTERSKPTTEDTTDELSGETDPEQYPTTESKSVTTMLPSSPRTVEKNLTTLNSTTIDWQEASQSSTTESRRTYLPTSSRPQTTVQNSGTTDDKQATESVTTALITTLVAFTTVKKDDETNPIADPQTTTTALPSNCSEPNSYSDCERFLMAAPYLCYDDDIQWKCCSTCISIANVKKAEIKISNCPYGDQERYCEDLDEAICSGSSVAREHCCERCQNYFELNTVPPQQQTTMNTAAVTRGPATTTQSDLKSSSATPQNPSPSTAVSWSAPTTKESVPTDLTHQPSMKSSATTSRQPSTLPSSSQQPTANYVVETPGRQLGFQAGNLEGTASVLVVVLPAIAVFIIILLVVLFVTIRHTSRVRNYLFRQQNNDEAAQLEEGMELR